MSLKGFGTTNIKEVRQTYGYPCIVMGDADKKKVNEQIITWEITRYSFKDDLTLNKMVGGELSRQVTLKIT